MLSEAQNGSLLEVVYGAQSMTSNTMIVCAQRSVELGTPLETEAKPRPVNHQPLDQEHHAERSTERHTAQGSGVAT